MCNPSEGIHLNDLGPTFLQSLLKTGRKMFVICMSAIAYVNILVACIYFYLFSNEEAYSHSRLQTREARPHHLDLQK